MHHNSLATIFVFNIDIHFVFPFSTNIILVLFFYLSSVKSFVQTGNDASCGFICSTLFTRNKHNIHSLHYYFID